MARLAKLTLLAVLSAAILVLAVINRQSVGIVYDPLATQAGAAVVEAPLFLVIFASLFAGVFIGAGVMWLRQSRWRRQAKARAAEEQKLQRQIALLEIELADVKKERRMGKTSLLSGV